uniref:Uncharacterized protein n=1 Tax=Tanacetum cinerariifolium TaxID=118510 RepID=A0A6L2JP89_TANCI|nr:hypothetical protein [Tanacetum cinerariifolium]
MSAGIRGTCTWGVGVKGMVLFQWVRVYGELCGRDRIDMIGPSTFDFGIFLGNDFDLWARKVPELGFLIN